jgi:hypothetical protein
LTSSFAATTLDEATLQLALAKFIAPG